MRAQRSLPAPAALAAALALSAAPLAARAVDDDDDAEEATGYGLELLDGGPPARRVGQLTGRWRVRPATDPRERFGPLEVRSGLRLRVRATARSEVPLRFVGDTPWLRVASRRDDVSVTALRATRAGLRADLAVRGLTVRGLAVRLGDVRAGGDGATRLVGLADDAATHTLRAGVTLLCTAPGRRCVTLRADALGVGLRAARVEGAWTEVALRNTEGSELRLRGWVATARLVEGGGVGVGVPGLVAPFGDGCAHGATDFATPLRATPVYADARGARALGVLEASADSVSVRDPHPDGPRLELLFAPGVQLAWPGATCHTGWLERSAVRLGPLRSRGVTLAPRDPGEGPGAHVTEVSPALAARSGLAAGDVLLSERGQPAHGDLWGLRLLVQRGAALRVLRGGAERVLEAPAAGSAGQRQEVLSD